MQWSTLSEGETGIDCRDRLCDSCGTPFGQQEPDDIVWFPDWRDEESWEQLGTLSRDHGIDIAAETSLVCAECVRKIDQLLPR